jgi:hypothetical protein
MQIQSAEGLSRKLRSLADHVQHRLWVAVPYVGGWNAVKSLLGLRWRDSDDVRFRLLTDITNKGWLDKQTIEMMNSHGKIKHLLGLHAKVYIIDDHALVTSANLTDTAFARRREIGVFLSPNQSKQVIRTFEDWWDNDATVPLEGWLKSLTKSSHKASPEEPGDSKLSKLYSLPSPPPDHYFVSLLFRGYKAFLTSYREFAETYVGVGGRLFPNAPLYIETDMFLNYLFHDDGEPSKKYEKEQSPRNMTKNQQRAEVGRQAKRFRKWTEIDENDAVAQIRKRTERSSEIGRLLAQNRVGKIGWSEVTKVAKILHCMKRYRTRFLNPQNNRLSAVREEWRFLLHGTDDPIEARMTRCYQRLFGFGQSAVQELPGWYDPKKYPIRNGNSNAGLRFLGY